VDYTQFISLLEVKVINDNDGKYSKRLVKNKTPVRMCSKFLRILRKWPIIMGLVIKSQHDCSNNVGGSQVAMHGMQPFYQPHRYSI